MGESTIEFPTVLSSAEKQQIEANVPKKRVVYLLMVVCGIGPQDNNKLEHHLSSLKETAAAVRAVHFPHLTEDQFFLDFVSDDWRGHLHKTPEIASIDSTLHMCSPDGLGLARGFINNIGVDVVYYFTSSHRQRFLNAVFSSLNECYRNYIVDNASILAGAELYVGLFCHSLGSIISFDLLSGPPSGSATSFHGSPLEFPVHSFFGAGSPVPLFLSVRGAYPGVFTDPKLESEVPVHVEPTYSPSSPVYGKPRSKGFAGLSISTTDIEPVDSFALNSSQASPTANASMTTSLLGMETLPRAFLPYCAYYYNIFHPNDPVPYRIDPLIQADSKGTAPIHIPHWRTLGARVGEGIENIAHKLFSLESETAAQADTEAMINARVKNRFDFALQPKTTEEATQYIRMMQVHNKYWGCKDTLLFVLTQCLRHAFLDKPTPIGSLQSLHALTSFPTATSPITRGAISGAGGMQIRGSALALGGPTIPTEQSTVNTASGDIASRGMNPSQSPRESSKGLERLNSAKRERTLVGALEVKKPQNESSNAPIFGSVDISPALRKPVAGRRAQQGEEGQASKSKFGGLF